MKMRYLLLALPLLLGTVTTAEAQVSVGISIGINVPVYPQLVRVPGYPVYYDPRASSNYFFYDGLYWVFRDDNWYSSGWYNGPWQAIGPQYVPLYVLRIPVRYYRQPPSYFRGWRADAPPRWGEHWGGDWQQRRPGWDQWDRRAVPAAAPLPGYQRQYSGARYPQAVEQQHAIRSGNYRYQPREAVTRQQFQQQAPAPTQATRTQQEQQRPQPRMAQPQPQVPHPQAEQQRPQMRSAQPQAARPAAEAQRARPEPKNQGQEKSRAAPHERDKEDKN
jgi:flagellar biosynthesis GTPase FlhF